MSSTYEDHDDEMLHALSVYYFTTHNDQEVNDQEREQARKEYVAIQIEMRQRRLERKQPSRHQVRRAILARFGFSERPGGDAQPVGADQLKLGI